MQTNDKIINRIDKSPLITIDLEAFYPKGERVTLDLADWLWEGLVLKEAIFRAKLSSMTGHNTKENLLHSFALPMP